MFSLQRATESELAPTEFFKEIRKVLWNVSIMGHGFIVLSGTLKYFVFLDTEKPVYLKLFNWQVC